MSLPARQQHTLDEIELRLLENDPQLKSLFTTFTRLTAPEAMPVTETISARLPRSALLIGLIVTAVVGALVAALLTPNTPCPPFPAGRVAAGAAAVRVATCHEAPAADVTGGG
ncbi:MAG TPA: hypothetical protein VFV41_25405 [Streptosporangiaceae bacterium]|nr:hypothetical protein [Streptosporangiaceae bacterium]